MKSRVFDVLQHLATQNPLINWALKPFQISVNNGKYLNEEERITLAIGILACQQGLNTVIEHPFPTSSLAISASLGVLLADFYERKAKAANPLFRSDLVYVTRQIGLGIQALKTVKLANQSLHGIWGTQSGRSANIANNYGLPRVLVSSPLPGKIRTYSNKDSVLVVDATHPLTLERIDAIVTDKNITDMRSRIIIVPLGFTDQTNIFDKWEKWTWCTQAGEKSVIQTAIVSNDQELDENLEKIREKLSLLSRSAYPNLPITLLEAWGIYNRLSSLSINLNRYEDQAYKQYYTTPIRVRIDHLSSSINNHQVPHNIGDSEWPILRDSINNTYEILKKREPGKFWALASYIEDILKADLNLPLVVVTPTQLEANLVVRELSFIIDGLYNHLHPEGLTVTSIKSFVAQANKHVKLVFAGVPSSRWRFVNALPIDQVKILYPHEITTEKYIIRRISDSIATSQDNNNWINIISNDYPIKFDYINVNSVQDINRFTIELSVNSTVNYESKTSYSSTEDYSFMSPSWSWDSEDITFVPPISDNKFNSDFAISATSDTNWIEISFDDGRYINIPESETLDVFRRVTQELEECPAGLIQPGDIVILVLDGNFTSLYERIIEAMEAHPNYILLSVWIKLWNIVKEEVLERFNQRFSGLHKNLENAGHSITEQAVRTWYSGVMAPQSDEIVYHLINLSSNKAAMSNKEQIRRSLGHIRGMRRKTGRKIRQLVRQASIHDAPEDLVNDVDELALEDVLAAAEQVIVKNIRKL